MKAYIAAPIFNDHQLGVVEGIKDLLEYYKYDVFSPYHASREIWKGRAPKDCTKAERTVVLEGNVNNLLRPTNLLVAWVGGTEDGRTDTGVAWEMGFFHNRATRGDYSEFTPPPLTLAYIDPKDKRQSMNLMLAGTVYAMARGGTELQVALHLHAQRELVMLGDNFRPDRHVQHESDTIK